jgi:hypothetical protein
MAASRRTVLLGAALGVAIVVAAVVWTSSGSGPATGASPPRRAPARGQGNAGNGAPAQPVVEVNLEALGAKRAEPVDAGRNPFRFQPRAPVAPPPAALPPPRPLNQEPFVPSPPPGPPEPPPIPLKFIGLVTQGNKRVAVLSDGRSTPQSGEEGSIILGQYRILKIGNESIEMAYLDGRGRRTIRLTGQ